MTLTTLATRVVAQSKAERLRQHGKCLRQADNTVSRWRVRRATGTSLTALIVLVFRSPTVSKRPATFTQDDITRLIKGVIGAGFAVCITVDPRAGTFKIESREGDGPEANRKSSPPIVL